MTTEKWQLYSQTGVDGPEYGVRIRTGYTVVGFQKEDAQAIVAWQNASIQPEGDIMEKAKALRNAALPRQTYSIPGQTGYGNPSLSKGWDFSAVDELVRVVVLELIAEVERLRSLENCVSLVIDRQGKTNAALLGQLDVISAYLDAELAEWKNGDQIAEIAIKFMDLQKQKLNDANSQIAAKDARIKELEAELENLNGMGTVGYMLGYKKGGDGNKVLIDYIKRLEAAFLDSLAARLYYEHYPGVSDAYSWHDYPEDACHCMPKEEFRKKAREALASIKEGGKG